MSDQDLPPELYEKHKNDRIRPKEKIYVKVSQSYGVTPLLVKKRQEVNISVIASTPNTSLGTDNFTTYLSSLILGIRFAYLYLSLLQKLIPIISQAT